MRPTTLALLLALPLLLDIVHLTNGRDIVGTVVEDGPTQVVVKTPGGRMVFPRSLVRDIEHGLALSAALLAGYANAITLAVLWALQLSFTSIGQTWCSFGWESQLCETLFLAVFLVPLLDPRPFPCRPPPPQVVWLLRWLIVRIMLGAGLIKLRGDPAWRDLSALVFHYETQPLPNPLSRLIHFAPRWVHEGGVLWNHATELLLPFFAFGPPRLRRTAGVLFLLFQAMLIVSGNLSFLNWLTLCPAVACLDDGVWRRVLPARLVAVAGAAMEKAETSRAQERAAWGLVILVAFLSLGPVANLLSDEQRMNTSHDPLRLVNSYGAFGSVGRVREELVIEGTLSEDPGPGAEWRAYELPAKPGDPARRPPFVAPYHYRLDWLLWFAAMRGPESYPWSVNLVWKLLAGDPRTLSLFRVNPFPDRPPRWIRVELYHYKLAPLGSDVWWERRRVGPWLQPLSRDDERLKLFLFQQGWLRDERH